MADNWQAGLGIIDHLAVGILNTPYASPSGCKSLGKLPVLGAPTEIHSGTALAQPCPRITRNRWNLGIFLGDTVLPILASIFAHSAPFSKTGDQRWKG